MSEVLIDLNQAVKLEQEFLMGFKNGILNFFPARRFETKFEVKKGTGEPLVKKFEGERDANRRVHMGVFTPNGLKDNVEIVNLQLTHTERPYPADTLRAEVDLTLEQIWAFETNIDFEEFGY